MNLSQRSVRRPVLFVIGSAEIGGAEKQLVRLARELKARGVNVEVAFTQSGGPLTVNLDVSGIPWKIFPIRLRRDRLKTLGAIVQFFFYLVRRRPALVNAWLPESAVIALSLARIAIPSCLRVASVRGNPLRNVGKFGVVYRKVLLASDYVLTNASHLEQILIKDYGISESKVSVIPNGVDIPITQSDVSVQPCTAVVVANFHSYKGHHLLLEAVARVSIPLKVRLCGGGSAHKEIDEAIDSLGLNSIVSIVDSPADIALELRSAQFAIHPSTTEGLSNAILEELASGLPVIAFDIEGNLPVIKHGENGLLVKKSDVAGLAKAIEIMVSEVSLRNRLADGARSSASNYSWDSCVLQYEKLFSTLIKKVEARN